MANTEFRVSTLIDNQVPDFVQSDHPVFVQFLKAYYEWLEDSEEGQAIYESRKLLDYADVDRTSEDFMMYFKTKFLPYFPEDILADKAKLIKNIREFYQQKGSEESLKFLFRVLYKEDIDVIYPKQQILIASDGKWKQPQALRLTTANSAITFDPATLEKRRGIGATSRASCIIESAYRTIDKGTGFEIFELYVSSVNRLFQNGENLEVSYVDANGNTIVLLSETIIGSLSGINIDPNNRGLKYQSGDPVVIFGGLSETSQTIQQATAVVNNVSAGGITTATVVNGGYGFRQFPDSLITITNDPSDNTGANATAQITAIGNVVTLNVNSDSIANLANITIGNTTYQMANFAFANVNTALELAFTNLSFNVGPIETITVTSPGTNYTVEPTLDARSYYDTDIGTQDILDLGRIAAVEVINGGSGYDANTDTIFINGLGNGTGATFTFTANVTGHILTVTPTNAGEGYRDTTVSITSANGTGAVLQAYRYGEGDVAEFAVDEIGRIQDFNLTNRGAGYVETPIISLRIKDITVSNVSGIISNGDNVYQGANANSYTFSATVDSYDSANNRLRIFNYMGTLDNELPLKLPTFNVNVVSVVTYGNGLAKANAEFLNGVIKYAGFYLNTDGFLSSDMRLQDDRKYHNYSYVVIAERALADYREALLDILHPSGMSLLGYNRVISDSDVGVGASANVFTLLSTSTEGNVSINAFASSPVITGAGNTTFRSYTAGDLLVINPDTNRMIVKEISNVTSNSALTLDSNTAFLPENRINVTTSNTFVILSGNSEFQLAANDVIRYNANGTIVNALVTSVSGNLVNTNLSSSVTLTNALYEIYPSINSASYIIIPSWDNSEPYIMPPETDPYWANTVSLLLFETALAPSNTIYDSKKTTNWEGWTANKFTSVDPIYGNTSAYITTFNSYIQDTSNTALYENFDGDYTLEFEIKFETFATALGFETSVSLLEVAYGHQIGLYQQTLGAGGGTRMYGKDVNSATKIYSGDMALNTKYHCALVRSGTNVTFWFNGVSMGSITVTPGVSEVAYRQYLNYRGDTNRKFRIDNFRTTKYARYTAPFTPPSAAFPTTG